MGNALEDSVNDRMAANRSLVERVRMYVPGYRGYKQKNLRRDEDRAIRDAVATELAGVKGSLSNASRATLGDLNAMRDSERLRTKVDRYCAEVKKSAAGYSAFRDSVKILETELDAVISWDAKLIDAALRLRETAERLERAADGGGDAKAELRAMEKEVDSLIEAFAQRDAVMKGFDVEGGE